MCPGAGCAKGADMPSRKSAGVVKLPGGQPQVRRRQRELVEYGRTVLAAEAGVLARMTLDARFATCVEWILTCRGRVVVSGMGKPGFIAQKLSATLASTGTPSHYLHPAEAAHGDLGRVAKEDVVLALSNSGETEEILRLLPALKKIGARVVALTRDAVNPLARGADLVLAIGDREEYALYHPGGKLGRGLMKVREVMRAGPANPLVPEKAPLKEAVAVMTKTPGRPGACTVVDAAGKLVGVFTDGDLRRIVERGRVEFDAPVSRVMSRNPRTVRPEALVADAARVLRQARIDQVPVVDDEGRAVGLLDAKDLIGGGEGNVSCRLGKDRLLVTPAGAVKRALRPADLVVVTETGEKVRGRGRASSELRMHLAAYRARPDVGAIVHAHPLSAVALTVAGLPPPNDVMPEASVVLGEVVVAPFATPGTDEVPRALGPLLAGHDVLLLERHGALALGRTLAEALDRLETLERVARVALLARLLGRCEPLGAEAVAKVLAAAGVTRA